MESAIDIMSFDLPPLTPLTLLGYKESTKHHILTKELAEDLRFLLSTRLQLYTEWELVYSLEQDGASLNTLYTRNSPEFLVNSSNTFTAGYGGDFFRQPIKRSNTGSSFTVPGHHHKKLGYLLVIQDSHSHIFGSFTNEYFHIPEENVRFYGNGECFLWKTKLNDIIYNSDNVKKAQQHVQLKAFPFTGINNFAVHCTRSFLAVGVNNSHYGLYLDSDLRNGESCKTLTFGNEPLCDSGTKFKVNYVELWKIGG